MDKPTRYQLSFENSRRILDQAAKINHKFEDLVYNRVFDSHKEAIRRINDLLYETANKKGISLYDLCFRTYPEEITKPNFKEPGKVTIDVTIQLIPIEFELEKGPGYWKGKYYNLKRKMQELIDSKEI